MQTPQFWWAAFAQGGGAGIYGDLVYSATTRGGQGFWSTVAGPVLGEIPGTIDVFNSIASGGDFGAALARYVKRWTAGVDALVRSAGDRPRDLRLHPLDAR